MAYTKPLQECGVDCDGVSVGVGEADGTDHGRGVIPHDAELDRHVSGERDLPEDDVDVTQAFVVKAGFDEMKQAPVS